MDQVTVNKSELVEILRKNRREHRDIFLKAQAEYRKIMIGLLDEQLAAARSGKGVNIRKLVEVTMPEDHTADYDLAIQMLDMEVNRRIVVSSRQFASFVNDEWEWSHRWATSNSMYVDSPKFAKYRG